MKKKILFLIVLLLFQKNNVRALTYGGCDYSSVSRMKSLVNNINISYDYRIIDNVAYFDVTLNNITPEMYFWDTLTNETYTYADTQNGEITIHNYTGTSGNYKFYSAMSDCYGTALGTKYYSFPNYNIYYTNALCSDIPNYSLCQKWVKINYSYDKFEKIIFAYKDSLNSQEPIEEQVEYKDNILNKIVEFYVSYYYYFLVAVILICGIIILIKRKKDKFKL